MRLKSRAQILVVDLPVVGAFSVDQSLYILQAQRQLVVVEVADLVKRFKQTVDQVIVVPAKASASF